MESGGGCEILGSRSGAQAEDPDQPGDQPFAVVWQVSVARVGASNVSPDWALMAGRVGVECEVSVLGRGRCCLRCRSCAGGCGRSDRPVDGDWRAVSGAAYQLRSKPLALDVDTARTGIEGLPEATHVLSRRPGGRGGAGAARGGAGGAGGGARGRAGG